MIKLVAVLLLLAVAYRLLANRWHRHRQQRRALIDNYVFGTAVYRAVEKAYPHLSAAEIDLVISGLRQYFHICNDAGSKMIAMPSQVVDVAWHGFILHTREYRHFCQRALGRFLHHTPAEAMRSRTHAQAGIRRAWYHACRREGINPKAASQLPLLFALDTRLGIADGFEYQMNCRNRDDGVYCAGHIGCGSGCGGDSDSGSSCSSGCGGD